MDNGGPSTFAFQAEVKQLLHLMVHSLVQRARDLSARADLQCVGRQRPAAIRESRAARAALTDPELGIRVTVDPSGDELTVIDNGIGMSREEVIENLGTIARSGTGQFLERLTGDQRKDAQLIGQFGVGFYSAFIVADEVTVLTRRADAPATRA